MARSSLNKDSQSGTIIRGRDVRNIRVHDLEKDLMQPTPRERRARAWELYTQGQSKREIAIHLGITYNTVLADLKKVAREKMEEVYDSGYITEKKVEYVGTLDSLISGLTRTMHQMVSSGQGGRAAPIANQIIRAVRTSAEIVGVLDQNLQVEVNDCRSNDLADLLGGGIPAAMGSAQVQQSSVVDVTPVESAQLPSSDAGDSRDGQ